MNFDRIYDIIDKDVIVHIYDGTSGEQFFQGELNLLPHSIFEKIWKYEISRIFLGEDKFHNPVIAVEVEE